MSVVVKKGGSLFFQDIVRLYQDIVVRVEFPGAEISLRSDSLTKEGAYEIEEDAIDPLTGPQLVLKLGTAVLVHQTRRLGEKFCKIKMFGKRICSGSTVLFEVTDSTGVGRIYLRKGSIEIPECPNFSFSGKDLIWNWDLRVSECPFAPPLFTKAERKRLRKKVKHDSKTVWKSNNLLWKPEFLLAAGGLITAGVCLITKSCNVDGDPPLPPPPSLSVTKTDALFLDRDGDARADPGDFIEYTVVIANTGEQEATNVVFTDTPDANTTLRAMSVSAPGAIVSQGNGPGDTAVEVTFGALPGGGSATLTFQVEIDQPFPIAPPLVCNQGAVIADGSITVATEDATVPGTPDSPGEPAEETCTDIDAEPELNATLIAEGNDLRPGDILTYTVTITNSGDQDASNVVLTDMLDANTTLVASSVTTSQGMIVQDNTAVAVEVGTLAGNGGTATIIFQVIINQPFSANTDEVCDQALIMADNHANVLTDAVCTPVDASTNLVATKVDALQVNNNELVVPGDTIRYTINITNTGNQDAANVVFTDTPDRLTTLIPGSVTTSQGTVVQDDLTVEVSVGTLAGNGGFVEIVFDVTIDNLPRDRTQTISNQGTVMADNDPGTFTDDPDTPNQLGDPTVTSLVVQTDLSLTKTVNNATPDLDAVVSFEIIVTNDGPNDTNVEVTDFLPDGLTYLRDDGEGTYAANTGQWNVGLLLANQSNTLHIQVQVNTITPVTNTAEVTSSSLPDPDSVPGDGMGDDFDTVTITPQAADLAVEQKVLMVSDDVIKQTFTATFLITVTNNGPSTTTGVLVNNPIPGGAVFIADTPSQGAYDAVTGLWTIGTLPAISFDNSATLEISFDTGVINTLFNLTAVSGDLTDPNQANNKASASAQSALKDLNRFSADLSLTKEANVASAVLNDLVVYTIAVSNAGPSTTARVEVEDQLPNQLAFIGAEPERGSYYEDSGIWEINSIKVGETLTLTLTTRVVRVDTIQIVNRAEIVASTLPDPDSVIGGQGGNGIEDDEDTATIDLSSNTTASTLRPGQAGIPTVVELNGNYPNPFNPETIIRFGLPEAAPVTITVYDVLGREVATLVEGRLAAGRHEVTWHADRWPSGVYLVRLQAADVVHIQRITLAK